MDALFIGHSYIDVTMRTQVVPRGDEKAVAEGYAVSFGGNAVTAAFACAKLIDKGVDLVTSLAPDWLGHMFMDMAASYGIRVHPRRVRRSSLSFVLPNDGKRAILRARDADFLEDFPRIDTRGVKALHVDGHMPDAAIHYARACRETGALVSLDGGALRPGILELLDFVDVAVVAERLCEQMSFSETEMLEFLRAKGCRIGAVTTGEKGMLWYDETGAVSRLPALPVPSEAIIDTSGAGDVFHGAYLASYVERPREPWLEHFRFARAASAYKIQHLGNEAGLPTKNDITATLATFPPAD